MSPVTTPDGPAGDEAIRAVVTRLSRPHPQGGAVIERAAILAEGVASGAIVAWIMAHSGEPEAATASADASRGLYGGRLTSAATQTRAPLRYVLPAGALR
jgi:hypothetical protein